MKHASYKAYQAWFDAQGYSDGTEDPIRKLERELWEKAGYKPEEPIDVQENEWTTNTSGWCLRVYTDDLTEVLLKDGKPMAGFYASFRGVYQAGGYVVDGDQHWYAHNFREDEHDTWKRYKYTMDSEIAKDACSPENNMVDPTMAQSEID